MSLSRTIANRLAARGSGRLASIIIRLAVLSTALCVAVIVVTSALIRGFQSEISSKVFGFWGHVHVVAAQSGDGLFEAVPFSRGAGWVDSLRRLSGSIEYPTGFEAITGRQRSRAGVRNVEFYIVKPGVIQTKAEIEGILLKGVGPEIDWAFFRRNLRQGELPDLSDSSASRKILLSEQTAARVQLELGDPFIVHFPEGRRRRSLRFEVGGLYRTGLEEYDTQFAIVDVRVLQDVLGWEPDQVSGVELTLEEADDAESVAKYVYYEVVPAEFRAQSVRERFPGILEWLELQDVNEYVITGLMLAVAVINMVTALLILILERARMVGVLRTLGMAPAELRRIFLVFGARILLRGLLWGNAVGIGLCVLQQHFRFVRLSEENYYLSYAPISLNLWIILGLNLGTLVLVMALLLLPAQLVTRIDPVRAIRFD